MFDKKLLNEILISYKTSFLDSWWQDEKFKWEAVKCFQDNWDINAENFYEMFSLSISKSENLLTSRNNFPAGMILNFIRVYPEKVREMFVNLFNEDTDVVDRIIEFKNRSDSLLIEYGENAAQHYQHENAISTYLWLRYPNKYYIYKFGEIKSVSQKLSSSFIFKRGDYSHNLRNFYLFYDELCSEIRNDNELISLVNSQLTDNCYSDPEYKTLTIDIGFYISRFFSQNIKAEEKEWWPTNYSPLLSVEDWVSLLEDSNVFTTSSLEIMKRLKDYGGKATCKQLSAEYGENYNFYNSGSSSLARRVSKKTNCPLINNEEGKPKWWPILYLGKETDEESGTFIWKLRNELSAALDKIDLSNIKLYAHDKNQTEIGYWWLNANPDIWKFSNIAIGEQESYTMYNDNGNKRRIFQNFIDAKVGDIIVGYEAAPIRQIVAMARVSADQDGQNFYFEKTEDLVSPIGLNTLKNFSELDNMEFFSTPQGSLFKLTKDEFNIIHGLIRNSNPLPLLNNHEKYTKEDFLSQVYISESKLESIVSVLKNKKNIILQGAPGVGKTFIAKRLAYYIIGEKDDTRVELIQFHQNYSYEEFIMGYKPCNNGFELKYGIFYNFCQKALKNPQKDYFFIIDEINRGNMSKIFGELLMLIEKDYRETEITLAYNGLPFSVPQNVYIIGMMNTADRSLSMIDYALRRRFSFIDIEPAFDSEGFKNYTQTLSNNTFLCLIEKIKDLNKEIISDPSLGNGFCIGHSYFCNATEYTDMVLNSIVEYDILPMLREYWFDDISKMQRWENILRGVLE